MGKKVIKAVGIFSQPLSGVYHLWAWILLFWSLYRYFFQMPEWIDEFIAKPLVFVAPVLWYVFRKEKRKLDSIGLTGKKFFTSLYVGIGFGLVFAVEGIITHLVKYGTMTVNPISAFGDYGYGLLVLSLATALSEEILCRGFIFTRLWEKTKSLVPSAVIAGILFMMLHVPVLLLVTKLHGVTLILFFITDFILAVANSMLLASTGSLVAPILVHIFWNMTVALYL